MIVLLGASGYIGQAFAAELTKRGETFLALSRAAVDYTQYGILLDFLRENRPSFLINAAGFTGKPNVDACEIMRAETLNGNSVLPITISHACLTESIPLVHVSSC